MVDKIYNSQTKAITLIDNPNGINQETGNTNWLQTVLDNFNQIQLFFVSGEVPNCESKYWKVVLSTESDNQIGSYAQYRIGTLEEMIAAEKEQADYEPVIDPNLESKQKLQQDKTFCQSIYDEFLLGNRANESLTPEEVIAMANDGTSTKVLVDSGAVTSLRVVIADPNNTTLTAEQKAYFLAKIDAYLAQ